MKSSEIYLKWVKQANLPPLTNTQYRFAEWLLSPKISSKITQIGDITSIFSSVSYFLKHKNN
jgi:hypothetical protein